MKKQISLPTFGEIVPGEGGRLGAIMRGNLVGGVRQDDYALIVPKILAIKLPWGVYGESVPGANSLTDGLANTQAMLRAKCPPALRIATLEADGHKDLYLAARAEYWALRANVPELFANAVHWTSTQGSSNGAIAQDFECSFSVWYDESYEFLVVPVRRIPLYHFNPSSL